MNNVKEVLVKARSLIADENNWVQGTMARTAEGLNQSWPTEYSTCFCAEGALRRSVAVLYPESAGSRNRAYHECIELLEQGLSFPALWVFNDAAVSHSEVLELFDKAIAECGT